MKHELRASLLLGSLLILSFAIGSIKASEWTGEGGGNQLLVPFAACGDQHGVECWIVVLDISPNPVYVGDPLTITGRWNVSGGDTQLEHYRIRVSWGDGTPDSTVPPPPFTNVIETKKPKSVQADFSAPHTYTNTGSFSCSTTLQHQSAGGQDFKDDATVPCSEIIQVVAPLQVTAFADDSATTLISVGFDYAYPGSNGHGNTPEGFMLAVGDTFTASNPDSIFRDGMATRYLFTGYSGCTPSGGGCSVTMTAAGATIVLHYSTEHMLTVNSGHDSPTPATGYYTHSAAITSGVTSPADETDGTRYVCTGFSGTGSAPSGSGISVTFTIVEPTTVTWNWETQHYLELATSPSGAATPTGEGWYSEGVQASITTEGMIITGNSRLAFTGWTTSDMGEIADPSSPSTTVLMDKAKTVTANYVGQFYIEVISAHDSPTPSQWVDSGSSFTASVTPIAEEIPQQSRWAAAGFTVDGGALQPGTSHTFDNVQAPHTIVFEWQLQYYLQVTTSVPGSTVAGTGWYNANTPAAIFAITPYQPATGHRYTFQIWVSTGANPAPIASPPSPFTTVLMDSFYGVRADWLEQWYITVLSDHDSPTPSQWVNAGDTFTAQVTSPADETDGTRYRASGFSVDSQPSQPGTSHTFTNVQSSHTVQFQWVAQYFLTMSTNYGTVTPTSGWHDSGTLVNIAASPPATGTGEQYVWGGWTGSGMISYTGPSQSATVTMNSPVAESAHWTRQFYVQVISAHDSPTPSAWVDAGSDFTANVVSPAEVIPDQSQYICSGFEVDGGALQSGISYTFVNVQAPHTIVFEWQLQYYLQVTTSVPGSTVAGTGWYNANTAASISASTPYLPSTTHRYLFTNWASIGINPAAIAESGSPSTTVLMDSFYGVRADWLEQWYITVLSDHDSPTPSQWVNAGDTFTAQVTSPADETPGSRYICTGYSADGAATQPGTAYAFSSVQDSHTIQFFWKQQHYLTVTTNFGTVTPPSGWYDADVAVTIIAIPDSGSGIRFTFTGWTGSGTGSYTGANNPAQVTMHSPINQVAAWAVEYYLTITTNYGTTSPVSGWYVAGTPVTIEAVPPSMGAGERYTFQGWTGAGSGSYTGTANPVQISMGSPTVQQALWSHEFYLEVISTPIVVTDPAFQKTGWYESGTAVTVTAPTVVDMGSREGYTLASLEKDGTVVPSLNSVTATMDSYHLVVAAYRGVFKLDIYTDPSRITEIPGSGWYQAGQKVQLNTRAVIRTQGVVYVFLHWTVDAAPGDRITTTSMSVTMDQGKLAIAHYSEVQAAAGGGSTEALAVWQHRDSDSLGWDIYYSVYERGRNSYPSRWWAVKGVEAVTYNALSSLYGDETDPDVAIDLEGYAVAVWARQTDTLIHPSGIWYSQWTGFPPNGWTTPEPISQRGFNDKDPSIAFDSNGRAIAVWVREYELGSNMLDIPFYSVWDGITWTTAEPIVLPSMVPTLPGRATFPEIAFTSMEAPNAQVTPHTAVAIWRDWSEVAGEFRIFSAFWDGAQWVYSGPELAGIPGQTAGANAPGADGTQRIGLSSAPSDQYKCTPYDQDRCLIPQARAVWQAGNQVFYSDWISGSWQPAVALTEGSQPAVAFSSSGGVLMTYSLSKQATEHKLYYTTFMSPPEMAADSAPLSGGSDHRPATAYVGASTYLTVWHVYRPEGSHTAIFYSTYNEKWASPAILIMMGAAEDMNVQLAAATGSPKLSPAPASTTQSGSGQTTNEPEQTSIFGSPLLILAATAIAVATVERRSRRRR